MGDRSPDPGPAPPADGLRDAPQRDRCSEDRGLGRRPWTRKKTVDSEEDRGSEVSPIEDQENQSLKFDFHVNVFNIKVIVRTGRSGLTGPIFVTF